MRPDDQVRQDHPVVFFVEIASPPSKSLRMVKSGPLPVFRAVLHVVLGRGANRLYFLVG